MSNPLEVRFFLQISPEYGTHSYDQSKVVRAKAVKITQQRPENPEGQVVEMRIMVPEGYFEAPVVEVQLGGTTVEDMVADIKEWTN